MRPSDRPVETRENAGRTVSAKGVRNGGGRGPGPHQSPAPSPDCCRVPDLDPVVACLCDSCQEAAASLVLALIPRPPEAISSSRPGADWFAKGETMGSGQLLSPDLECMVSAEALAAGGSSPEKLTRSFCGDRGAGDTAVLAKGEHTGTGPLIGASLPEC